MSFNISSFEDKLKSTFKIIKKSQAEAISIEIAANYTVGRTAGEKHKSIIPAVDLPAKVFPANQLPAYSAEREEDGLTTEEKEEIAILAALFLGYINKFNDIAQAQILKEVKSMSEAGKSQDEIQQYVKDVFSGNETITIDNVGKKKKEIYVDKDLKLSEVTKIIEKPFFVSLLTYASMTGENVAHTAYEKGREMSYRNQGLSKWVFVGPADEVARPHHVVLLGETFTFGTQQSEYAQRCLHEPRCRHRAQVYRGDGSDVSANYWRKLKEDVGLYWDDSKRSWQIKTQ